jgi:hypothetical protein
MRRDCIMNIFVYLPDGMATTTYHAVASVSGPGICETSCEVTYSGTNTIIV